MSVLAAALAYVRLGWPVLPLHTPKDGVCDCGKREACESPGKHPRTMHGLDDASLDEDQVRRWWGMWPHANVAIDLARAGLVDAAPDSVEWHAEFIARGLPTSVSFASGGGQGHEHYLFARPERCPAHRLCREGEYDILSNGYAVMPPSVHQSGQQYAWLSEDWTADDPGPPPQWLVDMLVTAVIGRQARASTIVTDGAPPVLLRGEALERWQGQQHRMKADGSPERSGSLYAIGQDLAEAGLLRADVLAEALRERDETIGWAKFTDRTDGDVRYDEIAQQVIERAAEDRERVGSRAWTLAGQRATGSGSSLSPDLYLDVVDAAGVEPEIIDWLWYGRLARGKPTLLMGDPGLGKSLLMHTCSSTVSVGGVWPDGGQAEQGAAIIFSVEDGLGDTVVPRLLAAGADLHEVVLVRGVIDRKASFGERMFALTEHIQLLEDLIVKRKAVFVVMDPITSYLGSNVNSHKESDVRMVLGPLQMMCERTRVALVMVMHLTKGSGVSALYRATGSIAFPAVARIVLGIAPDPNDDEGKRRLLLPIKMNVGELPDGIGYRIQRSEGVLRRATERDQPPLLVWDTEPVLVDASSAMDRAGTVQEIGALAECKRALSQIMADGKILSREGERQLKEAGASTSPSILVRARRELGITTKKEGLSGPWYWIPADKDSFHAHAHAHHQTTEDSEKPNTIEGFTASTKTSTIIPKTIEDSEDSRFLPRAGARVREGYVSEREVRLCPRCKQHMDVEVYPTHLPCTDTTGLPEGLCPIHRFRFDMHDCDAL